ncbi:zinc finger protein 862-like [Haliotis rubra]|uniref:zinc finger protein 862-like n=1 Tax=Haliotis rubra TaxID=36100 RepID=UPI001EE5C6B2|nr:zinc finger protein 862-like [Haliotis rubra]
MEFGRPVGRDGKPNHFVTGSLGAQYASEIKPGQSEIEKGMIHLNERETAKLSKLFVTAFHLAQREMPFTEFVEFLRLQTVNFDVHLMKNHCSDKQARTFVKFIAQNITATIMNDVKGGCFTILCDGSTDSSVTEEEIIYVRYIEQVECKPVTKFLCVWGLEKADAAGIYEAIDKALTEIGDFPNWKEKVVSFTSDGAPVMMGRKGGVAAKLRNDVPHVIPIPCIAHRLELAMKNAGKDLSLLSSLDKLMEDVYKFYHYSPLNWTGLQETGEALSIKVVRPVNIYGTRWAGHRRRALMALNTDFIDIYTHCTQVSMTNRGDSGAKARHILDRLKLLEFVLFMHMMLFYFAACAMLSDVFQDNDTSIDLIPVRMHAACAKMTETDVDKMAVDFLNEEVVDGKYKTVQLEKKKRGCST